jgi:bacteriorhodopsin
MKEGNGIGVFKAIQNVDEKDTMFSLIKYLTNWVANAKLIFVALAITIVIFGNETTQFHAVLALMFSTFMFYITLYPILKKLDDENLLVIKGYSKTLAYTILSFILMFIIAIILYEVL